MTATVASVLAAIVSRDFADDLVRAVTFGGGYRPTVRVMVQRHWAELRERIAPIAATVRADGWRDGDAVGFRDNRDTVTHTRDLETLAGLLKADGFAVRRVRIDGRLAFLEVGITRADTALVEAAAPLYIARIDAAMNAADAA